MERIIDPGVQLSLFDEERMPAGTVAQRLFDGKTVETEAVPDWVLRLVPETVAVIRIGDSLCALCKSPLAPEQVQQGHEYSHYLINGSVYAGTFVGADWP